MEIRLFTRPRVKPKIYLLVASCFSTYFLSVLLKPKNKVFIKENVTDTENNIRDGFELQSDVFKIFKILNLLKGKTFENRIALF